MIRSAVIIALCHLFLFLSVHAQQETLTGKVTDKNSGEPLVGVNIITNQEAGTTTDIEGRYSLELSPGKWQITFKYLGYKKVNRTVIIEQNQPQTLDVRLTEKEEELSTVVVSGSKYEKNIGKETVSIDVMKPELLKNSNSKDASEAMQKMPGVSIIDGQPIIRSGAGYAFGAGSRVQVMVDGQPLLAGDFMNVNWSFVPIENAQQIEVIKGASSVLYGTGALNGVINVRTGYAKEEGETSFTLYQGVYDRPKDKSMVWWSEFYAPYFTGAYFNHRKRYGNLDLVIGGNLSGESSYLQGGDEQKARVNFKTRYHPPNNDRLTYGLNGNIMYNQNGEFFLWENADSGALQPMGGFQTNSSTITANRFIMTTLDPHLTYFSENDIKHEFQGRYYNVTRLRLNNPNATSHLGRIEYQLQKRFNNDWIVTGGTEFSFSRSMSPAYDEQWHNFSNGGIYVQAEKNFDRLSLVGGSRFELNTIDRLVEASIPVFRAGLNYEPVKGTFLRASFGQGFRFPSIAERFVSENLSSIRILPNPQLEPEQGWNSEIGIKQTIKISDWLGYVDLATFWTEYQDMILFEFGQFNGDIGFRSSNTGRQRIAGFELSTMGEGVIGTVPVRLLAGYTYTYPVNMENDTTLQNAGEYMSNFFQAFGNKNQKILNSLARYRFQHTVKADIEADVNQFTFGYSLQYNSFMQNIDKIFVTAIDGIKEFRANNSDGDLVMNARVGYRFSNQSKLTFLAKNVTNELYSQRPAKLQPPRNFTLQYQYDF